MTAYILPRYILGNRGDLASRWGVLRALHSLGVSNVTVFCHTAEDVPPLPYRVLPYRPLKNLYQNRAGRQAFHKADTVLWAVGLDIQDDSSLVRLLYLWVTYHIYRLLGLRIVTLFQGAGPLTTRMGQIVAGQVLKQVDAFVARDPGTYALVGKIRPDLKRVLAYDAIFLPGFEEDARAVDSSEKQRLDSFYAGTAGPVVGVNIRQWFHFSASIIPYQLSQNKYRQRSLPKMAELTEHVTRLVDVLRSQFKARVLLISAYQPDIYPWEDDIQWLALVKGNFSSDKDVLLATGSLTQPGYYNLISRLNLMIGMRLHSSLIALRLGVPAMNLSYTLKGGDIMNALGLGANVTGLNDFLQSPQSTIERAAAILSSLPTERKSMQQSVAHAIQTNFAVMQELFEEES